MRKKIIFIVCLIILCCGCTSEYTIVLDKDLKVKETMIALEDSEFYSQYKKSSVQRVIGFILNPNLEYLNNNGFVISNILGSKEAGVKITNEYDSIEKYKEISKIIYQFAEDFEYSEDGDYITLRIIGSFNGNEQDQSGKYVVDSSKISIQLPHTVKEHNANNVDEDNDVYTWIFEKSGEQREILIVFNKKVPKDYTVLYVLIGGIILIVIGGYYFMKKTIFNSKDRNEI